jgi:hypothetical protein
VRSFLFIFLAAILAPLHAAPWFDGADLSALGRIEELGGTFRDNNGHSTDALADKMKALELERYFKSGSGHAFARRHLWSNAPDVRPPTSWG